MAAMRKFNSFRKIKISMKQLTIRLVFLFLIVSNGLNAQVQDAALKKRHQTMSTQSEQKGLEEPFKGITKDGNVQNGVFEIRSTGVSTSPVRTAANLFLQSLNAEQKNKTKY